MKKIKLISAIAISALLILNITSCKNDKDDKKDNPMVSEPSFNFSSPEASKMYGQNDTISIKGTITWETDMHGYEINLYNESNNDSLVFNAEEHTHGTSFSIDEFWVNQVSDHSDMKLEIKAFTDHDGNFVTKVIHFHCHPM